MLGALPYLESVQLLQIGGLGLLQHLRDVEGRRFEVFHTCDPLQYLVRLRLSLREHNPRTVDQVDPLGQPDVLPDLGLPRDGRHLAHLLAPQGVDDGTLPDVRVADESHADLLPVRVQPCELPQQVDEGALAERVAHRGVEGEGGVRLGERGDPVLGCPGRHQVALVQQENEVLVRLLSSQVRLHLVAPGPWSVPGVQHLYDDVRGVDHLVELAPDAAGLASRENNVQCLLSALFRFCHQISVARLIVAGLGGLCLGQKAGKVAGGEIGPLPLSFGAEGVLVRLGVEEVHPGLLPLLLQERDRKFASAHHHLVRVARHLPHRLLELLQRALSDHTGVSEPLPVRLHSPHFPAFGACLEGRRLQDLALLVTDGLPSVLVHLQPLDGALIPHAGGGARAVGVGAA